MTIDEILFLLVGLGIGFVIGIFLAAYAMGADAL